MYREFIPKSYFYLHKNYTLSLFRKDLLAGITVGIIAIPLAMAFAIASGVTPMQGIITAIVAGFLISLLGGSRAQIGGPAGAFIVLIYDIVQRSGYEGLVISTIIGGILLILFGLFRLGSWIKYVPYPLITGFTTALAIIIFSFQIKDFFGLQMGAPPGDFVEKWGTYFTALPTFHGVTVLLGLGTLALILVIRKFNPKLPWGITAIAIATPCTYLFSLPVATIGSSFGNISTSLPLSSFPSFDVSEEKWRMLVTDGIAIALLGAIESLLSAVIADGMMGTRHKSNCELLGQGIANIGSALCGGIPATGTIARTATNIKTGAQTPLAGMIHAITILIVVLFLAPLISHIPLASLSAVLIMVAWTMSEIPHFLHLLKAPIGDVAILLTAFLLTLFVDITTAVTFGMILSSFLFMKRMSENVKTVQLTALFKEPKKDLPESSTEVPPEVEVYEIQGPFFFGAADMLRDVLINIRPTPQVFILRLRQVSFIDASGIHALREFSERCKRENTRLLLSETPRQTQDTLQRMGFIKTLGKQHLFDTFDEALKSCNNSTS